MRYLTIKRTKRFAGCAARMKVYIEDWDYGDVMINKIPCRKLGVLKNGEEKTFQIDEEAAKVFVIADKLSRNLYNDYYQLPYGYEDVYLSGKNTFNPFAGNPFRFDNNNSREVQAHRKKVKRRMIFVCLVAGVVGFAIGLFNNGVIKLRPPEEKTFYAEGMSISLTDEFTEAEYEHFTAVFVSRHAVVFALKEDFSDFDDGENYSIEQYAEIVLQANGLDFAQLNSDGDLNWFEYVYIDPETNDTYWYCNYVYKAYDAFWLLEFATLSENVYEFEQQFDQWAKSVSFVI